MTEVFVIRNQHGHYWGKSKEWVSGSEPKTVMRAKHHDDALNTLFELSSKDIDLRGEVATVELSERGEPIVEPSAAPTPAELEAAAEEAKQEATQDNLEAS